MKFVLKSLKPQFILDEKMCLHHGIKYGRPFNAGAGKILPINCLAIGKSIHFRNALRPINPYTRNRFTP